MKTARAFYDTPDAAAMDLSEELSSRLVAAMAFGTDSTFPVGHKAQFTRVGVARLRLRAVHDVLDRDEWDQQEIRG